MAGEVQAEVQADPQLVYPVGMMMLMVRVHSRALCGRTSASAWGLLRLVRGKLAGTPTPQPARVCAATLGAHMLLRVGSWQRLRFPSILPSSRRSSP